jgi:hypothetical protein
VFGQDRRERSQGRLQRRQPDEGGDQRLHRLVVGPAGIPKSLGPAIGLAAQDESESGVEQRGGHRGLVDGDGCQELAEGKQGFGIWRPDQGVDKF